MMFDQAIAVLKALRLPGGFGLSVVALVRAFLVNPGVGWATLKWIAVYCVYCAAGLGLVLAALGGKKPPQVAAGAALFVLVWVRYGAVWLARVPGLSETVLSFVALVGLGIAAAGG